MNDSALSHRPSSGRSRLFGALAAAALFAPLLAARAEPPVVPEGAPVLAPGTAAAAADRPHLLEASLAEGIVVALRPAHAAPGELFEIDLRGAGLRTASARLAGQDFPLFKLGEGHLRGYAAVPLTAAAGSSPLTIEARVGASRSERGELAFKVDERVFVERTLTVAAKFTRPSKEQKARMRADGKAFAAAYRVPFGAPLFSSNFVNPLGSAELNSPFGVRRVFNGKVQTRHLGIDLDGEVGTPIYAANDGRVRMVRPCFAAGNAVILSHGAGLFTSYFHLSKFEVKQGQRVKKGQRIGLVGKTGRVTGPHLHLSSKLAKTTFDPEALFGFDFFPEAPLADNTAAR